MNTFTRVWPLILLVVFLAGCATHAPIRCVGYPQAVCEKCGENPTEVRILKRMEATRVPELAKTKTSNCVDVYFKARAINEDQAEVTLNSCITTNSEIDEETRDALLRIVEDAIKDDSLATALEAWKACYKKAVGS